MTIRWKRWAQAFGISMAVWWGLATWESGEFIPGRMMPQGLLYSGTLVFFCMGFSWVLEKVLRRAKPPLVRVASRYHEIFMLLPLLLGMLVAAFADSVFLAHQPMEAVARTLWEGVLFSPKVWVGGMIFVAVSLWYTKMNLSVRMQAAERKALEARYDLLVSQTQPHFLMNALNGIVDLMEGDRKQEAVAMTCALGGFYGVLLSASQERVHSLSQELVLVETWLRFQKLRFGKKLDFKIEVDADEHSVAIPPLSLQTLVENAVKHGVARNLEGGCIEISIIAESVQRVRFSVTSPMPSPEAAQAQGSGFGLSSLSQRLQFLYGEGAELTAEPLDGERFRAAFVIRPHLL